MPTIIDSLNLISKTIDNILDFIAADDCLSKDFEEYLNINNIEINSEKDFNNTIIQYIFDMKMQSGLRVLEYYRRNNANSSNAVIEALLDSFVGVFKIEKIQSNSYNALCLASNAQITLTPMVKMYHLKQIGRYDHIEARIVEFNNNLYILEIYNVIPELDVYQARVCAIKHMLEYPKSAYYKNEKKKTELAQSAGIFYQKFEELFNNNFIITTNKKADCLIEFFNQYRKNSKNLDYSALIENVEKNRYIKIEELDYDEKTLANKEISGFSSHKETYDIGLFVDKERGLYIIPFLETFFKCFCEDIEGKKECLREFLTSDKVPPEIIKLAYDKYPNFLNEINKNLNTNFSTLEELLFNTKASFVSSIVFSSVNILFNSELFSSLLDQ